MHEARRKNNTEEASRGDTAWLRIAGGSSGIALLHSGGRSTELRGTPCLGPRTAHVWGFDVDGAAERHLLRCVATLSDEEARRAAQFDRRLNRETFVIGRGTIRRILGSYVACSPSSISISTGEYGKPMLDPRYGLHVNWSHAGTLWLLAVSSSGPIGVDIERFDPHLDWAGPAAIAYHASELAYVRNAEDPRRFLEIWTRKEAVFKGIGKGLHDSMNTTSVLGRDGTPADLLNLGKAGDWSLTDLPVAEPFVATLATSFVPANVQFLVDRRLQAGLACAAGRSCAVRPQQRNQSQ